MTGRYDSDISDLDFGALVRKPKHETPKRSGLSDFLRFADAIAAPAGAVIGGIAGGPMGAEMGTKIGEGLGRAGDMGADLLDRPYEEQLRRNHDEDEELAARHRAVLQMLGG